MKKIFGNIPVVPFAVFLFLALCFAFVSIGYSNSDGATGMFTFDLFKAPVSPIVTPISTQPDLTVTDAYLDTNKSAFVIVKNIGNTSSNASKLNATWHTTYDMTRIFGVPALAAGQEYVVKVGTSADLLDYRTVIATADYLKVVAESNENNNILSKVMRLLPDLTVTDAYLDSKNVTYVNVKNIRYLSSPISNLSISWKIPYAQICPTQGGGGGVVINPVVNPVNAQVVIQMPADNTVVAQTERTCTWVFSVPALAAIQESNVSIGTGFVGKTITATIDYMGGVVESNEINNVWIGAPRPLALLPDLTITDAYLNASNAAFARIKNIGNAKIGGGIFVALLKLNVSWWQTTACPAGTVTKQPDSMTNHNCIKTMDMSPVFNISQEMNVSLGTGLEGKTITIVADSTNGVAESNEGNNVLTKTLSAGATITLNTPANNTNVAQAASISFNWTPTNFDNNPSCAVYIVGHASGGAKTCTNNQLCSLSVNATTYGWVNWQTGTYQWYIKCKNSTTWVSSQTWQFNVTGTPTCSETDGGNNVNVKGRCTDNTHGTQTDACIALDSPPYTLQLYEYNCVSGTCQTSVTSCPSSYTCQDGKCVSSTPLSNCSGTLKFGLNQTTAAPSSKVSFLTNVTSSNFYGPRCGGMVVKIKDYSCSSPDVITTCTLDGTKDVPWPSTSKYQDCNSTFFAPSSTGIKNYVACIDMNQNGTYEGNEQKTAVLNVTSLACSDPDGTDLTISGTCTDASGQHNDSCLNISHVREYTCVAGACVQSPVYCGDGNVCRYGACGSGTITLKPDLIITGVYISDGIYAKIKNQGLPTTPTSTACKLNVSWTTFGMPGEKKQRLFDVLEIAAGQEIVVNITDPAMAMVFVYNVTVDALNTVNESNEGNNNWYGTASLPVQCVDYDGADTTIKGHCYVTNRTYLYNDTCVNDTHVIEYVCSETACAGNTVYCGSNSICYDGACVGVVPIYPGNGDRVASPFEFRWMPVGFSGTSSCIVNFDGSSVTPKLCATGVESNSTRTADAVSEDTIHTWNVTCDDGFVSATSPTLQFIQPKKGTDQDHRGPSHHCYENWSCTDWTECSNGLQTRTCTDLAGCGTTSNRPALVQSCTRTCTPSWSCGEWSACAEGSQTQDCTDSNRCFANYSYTSSRECCTENWQFVNWSECLEGQRFKIYEDFNTCGTVYSQPQLETEECGKNKMLTYILIGAGILIIALAILFFVMKRKKHEPLKGKAKEEAAIWKEKLGKTAEKEEKSAVPSELQNYVKKALDAGMTKDDVKARFVEAGWPKDMVDKALMPKKDMVGKTLKK